MAKKSNRGHWSEAREMLGVKDRGQEEGLGRTGHVSPSGGPSSEGSGQGLFLDLQPASHCSS